MELPNIHFQDFPIDFKKINTEDFPDFFVEEKVIISPDDNGYITTNLLEKINPYEIDTTVINAAVGQGKTYSIIQIIKEYYEAEENYLIFVAAPYTSLVQQYCQKINELGIPKEQIYSYDYIGNETHIDAWNSKIQVLTANALLGNPGDNDFINSQLKRNYINYLVRKCEETNTKAIFIYDEIHDSYYNFKEEYIFNLWKWRNVICKNILLSATYNEASKVVIEYLAELTDNKIKIIESERVRFPDKQSDLYLHYNPAKYYSHDNDDIVDLVKNLISQGKNIDVLSFSKTLADNICNNTDEGIGKVLLDAEIKIQNCTSDLDDNQRPYREIPQNRYRPNRCNIGTNFKSGVSIEKDNHAFIVILPPLGRKGAFKNKFGIFSDGINSVIQALARQRNSSERTRGEIHIVLPPPDKFDISTLPFDEEQKKEVFSDFYQTCQNFKSTHNDLVVYYPINSQDEVLMDYYQNTIHAEIIEEETHVCALERSNKVRLDFPSYKLFKLNKAEKYFANKIKFFGKDLSAYITYAAATNQFVNCKLAGVNMKPTLFLEEGKIQFKLEKFYRDYFDVDNYNSYFTNVTDRYKFYQIRNELFNYKILYKAKGSESYEEIASFSNKNFEQQFLAFCQRKFYPFNRTFANRFFSNSHYRDNIFFRGDYFTYCIAHAHNTTIGEECNQLVEAYKSLDYFRKKIVDNLKEGEKNGAKFLYVNNTVPSDFIEPSEYDRYSSMCEVLIKQDPVINNEVFQFKKAYLRTEDLNKKINSLYNYLIEDFLITEPDLIYSNGSQTKVKTVHGVIDIPHPNVVIDLVNEATTTFPDSYWETDSKKRELKALTDSVKD